MAQAVRFYTDEHISRAVIKGLRQRGVDVLSVQDTKLYGASDRDHLARATSEKRIIVTHDADFLRLNRTNHDHFGIAYAHRFTSVGDMIRGLMLIHLVMTRDEMQGRVEYI